MYSVLVVFSSGYKVSVKCTLPALCRLSLSACCGSFGLWPRVALWGPAQRQTDYIRALIADALPAPHKWWMNVSSCGRERAKDTPIPPFLLPPSTGSLPSWASYDEAPCLSSDSGIPPCGNSAQSAPDQEGGRDRCTLHSCPGPIKVSVDGQVAQSVRGVSVHCDPSMSSMLMGERWSLGSFDSDTLHLCIHIRT